MGVKRSGVGGETPPSPRPSTDDSKKTQTFSISSGAEYQNAIQGSGGDKSVRSSSRPSSSSSSSSSSSPSSSCSSSKTSRGAGENSSVAEKSARSKTQSASPLSPSKDSHGLSPRRLGGKSPCPPSPKETTSSEERNVTNSPRDSSTSKRPTASASSKRPTMPCDDNSPAKHISGQPEFGDDIRCRRSVRDSHRNGKVSSNNENLPQSISLSTSGAETSYLKDLQLETLHGPPTVTVETPSCSSATPTMSRQRKTKEEMRGPNPAPDASGPVMKSPTRHRKAGGERAEAAKCSTNPIDKPTACNRKPPV